MFQNLPFLARFTLILPFSASFDKYASIKLVKTCRKRQVLQKLTTKVDPQSSTEFSCPNKKYPHDRQIISFLMVPVIRVLHVLFLCYTKSCRKRQVLSNSIFKNLPKTASFIKFNESFGKTCRFWQVLKHCHFRQSTRLLKLISN